MSGSPAAATRVDAQSSAEKMSSAAEKVGTHGSFGFFGFLQEPRYRHQQREDGGAR